MSILTSSRVEMECGIREMSIVIEGYDVLYDLFCSGFSSRQAALKPLFAVLVEDGALTISFDYGPFAELPPLLSALEVHTSVNIPLELSINCGGSSFIGDYGEEWVADDYFSGGTTTSFSSEEVADLPGPAYADMFRSLRGGSFSYEIPVVEGSYTFALAFTEFKYVFWCP